MENFVYAIAWNLSKLGGKVIYIWFVVGNITKLKTRNMNKIIQAELTHGLQIWIKETDKSSQEINFS